MIIQKIQKKVENFKWKSNISRFYNEVHGIIRNFKKIKSINEDDENNENKKICYLININYL